MTESRRIYIDTSPYIYYLEKNLEYGDRVKEFLMDNYNSGKEFVTSTITIEEYSIIPYRENNIKLLKDFDMLIEDTETDVIDITKSVAKKAAQIRADYKSFKAMDALQLASAVKNGCGVFLTNDKQLRQFKELTVITMDDL
ncbi:MAG: type II toxin-antitoxin system VapC family toxin [Dorea sp.]|nr:type II toxin-antitoxin system VapC family toxin [Dorea sp.]